MPVVLRLDFDVITRAQLGFDRPLKNIQVSVICDDQVMQRGRMPHIADVSIGFECLVHSVNERQPSLSLS